MAGTSPFTYQSPSYHSSSYLPKLEANFMRDFSCCGITLPSLHDLLQHYEESHAQQLPQSVQRSPQPSQSGQQSAPSNKAALAAGAAAAVQQRAQQQQQQQQQQPRFQSNQASVPPSGASQMGGIQLMRQQQQGQTGGLKSALQTVQDMDTVEDMEMDDDDGMDGSSETTPPPPSSQQSQMHQSQKVQLSQQHSRAAPPVNLKLNNIANPIQTHQGLRSSQPTTPATSGHPALPFQHNPTVSSVNTPTLSTQPMQQQNTFSPETSLPGTPSELDDDYSNLPADMSLPSNSQFLQGNFGGYDFGGGNDMLDLCIDEPAKRLFSPNGGFNNQQYTQFRMQGGQLGGNSEIARRIQEQQLLVGIAGTGTALLPGEEIKPFRCPVIGCEKAYKNQNGLKYHKTVSTDFIPTLPHFVCGSY
jgi:transcription factor SFP1